LLRDFKITLAALAVIGLHAVLARHFGYLPAAILIVVIATII
jgi:hypothetical protein